MSPHIDKKEPVMQPVFEATEFSQLTSLRQMQ